jgi:hypothetical protein
VVVFGVSLGEIYVGALMFRYVYHPGPWIYRHFISFLMLPLPPPKLASLRSLPPGDEFPMNVVWPCASF